MLKRISNSWGLVQASLNVLQNQPKLMTFPLVTAGAMVLIALVFIAPLATPDVFFQLFQKSYTGYILLLVFYILQYVLLFFLNAALSGAALIRLRGSDPSLEKGLRLAAARLLPILGYAGIAATVGVVIKLLTLIFEKRKGFVAETILNLYDFKWPVATFLVTPVLVFENARPLEAIERSVAHLKRAYGDDLEPNLTLTPLFFAINLGIVAASLVVLIAIALFKAPAVMTMAVVSVSSLLLIFNNLVCGTLQMLFVAAVYQFAVEGELGFFYNKSWIKKAFISQ